MRRTILFSLFLLALSLPVKADKVPPQQAAAVAERFLSAESPATKSSYGPVRLIGTWPQAQTKGEAKEPALYLFEREGGGYVVVAADDVSLPVIGYSTKGRLTDDELPCNLRFMLDWHASMIDYARNQGLQATAATKAQWMSITGNEGEGVLLETAHWNQSGEPYITLIPQLNGKQCPAGCVASAMAIILRYYQWPEKGTGTLPGYYWSGGKTQIEDQPLDHVYDWGQMPLVYEPGQYTVEQGHQVAQLLYDLAIMSEMNFYSWGSEAAGDAPLLLATYFGYDKQIRYHDWDYYGKEEWEEIIRTELDAARPVFYGGSNGFEGHAFVVDGYKGPYFSLNYGWGYGSEYYLLRPSVPLDADRVTDFCEWACMVTHIYPDQGGEVYTSFYDDELIPFPWDFRSKSFPVGGREIYAYSSGEAEATLGFVLFDREGSFKATTGEPVLVSSSEPSVPELTCNITCSIEEGDCLKLAQLVGDEWVPLRQTTKTYFEFHPGKKISELISLDFTLGDVDYPYLPANPYLYLCGVKEIYWEIWSEDYGELLATSKSLSRITKLDGNTYTMVARWDDDTNMYRAVCSFKPGTYRLFLRNFDEEMTVYVKL